MRRLVMVVAVIGFSGAAWAQNIGIGTNTPQARLHVKGSGFPESFLYLQSNAGHDAGIRLYEGETVKWHIFNQSTTGGLNIASNSLQPALFVSQPTGFVGIGTNTPLTGLDVNGQIRIAGGSPGLGKVLTSDAAGLASWQVHDVITDASFTGTGTAASPLKLASFGASAGQVLKWTGTTWDNAADDRGPWSETTDYIYNSTSKNFGMGINVPTQKLTLAEGGTTCYMNIQNSSTGFTSYDGMYIGNSGINSFVSTYEAGSLYLGTSATVRLAILSDGKVGIGTLTPGYKLDVKGTANLNNGISLGQALTVNGDEALWYDGTYFSWGYGGTWNYFKDAVGIDCQPGDGHMLAVNGVASKPGGGTWAAFSDARLKDVGGKYARGLSDLVKLQPVRYHYKASNPLQLPSDPEYVGFVAQDVQQVFPEAVTRASNGYLEFDMHVLNVAVINALKELKAENELLKARLEKLEKERR